MNPDASTWNRRPALLAAMVALALVAAGASPARATHDPDYEPYTPTERAYFRCIEGHYVQNAAGEIPGWDTSKPEGVALRGDGCGTYDNAPMAGDPAGVVLDAQWAGTYTGNLRDATFTLYNVLVGGGVSPGSNPQQLQRSMVLSIKLFIDGQHVPLADPAVPDDFFEVSAQRRPNDVRIEFSITGIDLLEEEDNRTHDVRLVLHNNVESQSFWWFGTVDTDAGITFNPAELAETQIRRVGS